MYIRSHFGSRLSGSSSVNGQTCCHWIGFRCLFEFAFSVGPGPCSRHSPRACGAILGVLWIGGLRELPVGQLKKHAPKLNYYLASIQACFCFSLFNLNEVLFAVQTLHMCVYMYIRSHFGSRLSGSSSVNGQTCCHWIGFRCLFEFAFSVGPGPCSRHSPRACGAILGVLWIGGLRELPVGHLCWWHRHWGLHRAFGGSGLVAASEVAQVALGLLCN